MEDRNRIVKRW